MRADSYYGVRTYTPQGGGEAFIYTPQGGTKLLKYKKMVRNFGAGNAFLL